MEIIIGKKYWWPVKYNSKKYYVSGILSGFDEYNNACMTSEENEEWIVPIDELTKR